MILFISFSIIFILQVSMALPQTLPHVAGHIQELMPWPLAFLPTRDRDARRGAIDKIGWFGELWVFELSNEEVLRFKDV